MRMLLLVSTILYLVPKVLWQDRPTSSNSSSNLGFGGVYYLIEVALWQLPGARDADVASKANTGQDRLHRIHGQDWLHHIHGPLAGRCAGYPGSL